MTEIMSVQEAAEELDIGDVRVRQLIYKGDLPAKQIGWQWVILRPDLDAYKKRRRPPGRPRKQAA